MPHNLLDINAVAEYLRLTREDIETLVRRLEIPHELAGGRLVFRHKDIDEWASMRILGNAHSSARTKQARPHGAVRNISDRDPIVSDLLKLECVTAELPGHTKPAVLRAMVKLAERSEVGYDPEDLLRSLREREELCSTALPGGVALLHPRHHEPYMFEDSFMAFGRVPSAVPFGAPDGGMTDLFFLICCQNDRIHLHVLSRLCLMVTRTTLLADLREALDSEAIMLAIQNAETAVIQPLKNSSNKEAHQ